MNIFRLLADLIHLVSIGILLLKILGAQNCVGISLKTQLLYCIVFSCRYLDLFWNFWSMYNWVMKVIFIISSYAIVYNMKFRNPICRTYDAAMDNFNIAFLIVPCGIIALFWNITFTPFEVLWAFSIYLESVSILPQLVMVQKHAKNNQGSVQNITSHYVFALGMYRALYLVNWFYRYFTEDNYYDLIAWVAGTVQTLLFADFFYYYLKAVKMGKYMELPV